MMILRPILNPNIGINISCSEYLIFNRVFNMMMPKTLFLIGPRAQGPGSTTSRRGEDSNLALGVYVLGIDCTGAACHEELVEKNNLQKCYFL